MVQPKDFLMFRQPISSSFSSINVDKEGYGVSNSQNQSSKPAAPTTKYLFRISLNDPKQKGLQEEVTVVNGRPSKGQVSLKAKESTKQNVNAIH